MQGAEFLQKNTEPKTSSGLEEMIEGIAFIWDYTLFFLKGAIRQKVRVQSTFSIVVDVLNM